MASLVGPEGQRRKGGRFIWRGLSITLNNTPSLTAPPSHCTYGTTTAISPCFKCIFFMNPEHTIPLTVPIQHHWIHLSMTFSFLFFDGVKCNSALFSPRPIAVSMATRAPPPWRWADPGQVKGVRVQGNRWLR